MAGKMFLAEEMDFQVITNEVICEKETGVKNYYIGGPFLEANTENRNQRIYPKPVLEREVKGFQEKIKTKSAFGELGHPENVQINEHRISHLIKELDFANENIAVGKAMVGDTPMGQIAKRLIDMGGRLGVSSRGVGTLKGGVVQEDYRMKTVDIVAEPSAHSAYVEAILESEMDWVLENGILKQVEAEKIQEGFKKWSNSEVRDGLLKLFDNFLTRL